MKAALLIVLLSITVNVAFSQRYIVSTVNLKEKQNKMAAAIPGILLDAYSKGDIKAYYPKNINISVPYVQFLHHFGMPEKAQLELMNYKPFAFCFKRKVIPTDGFIINCMEYSIEIVEKLERNHITYETEKKLDFIKFIYSGKCAADGLEMEGPIFKISDMQKLRDRSYAIQNPQNSASHFSVYELLQLRLYRSIP